jgi:cytochrome c oxidase cbb3-type subunit 1
VAGTSAGAIGGLFIHDLVGLFVTPLGWGLMYYFVPIMLKKPIWSHGLSLVGFWGLAFFYPLQGIHHYRRLYPFLFWSLSFFKIY